MRIWVLKRQLVGIAFFSFLFIGIAGIFTYYFYPRNSCTDSIKNGNEEEVDCGGSCIPCLARSQALRVLWTRIFPVRPGSYDVGAYIENPNFKAGSRRVRYTFKMYDASGVLLDTRHGVTYIHPSEKTLAYEASLDARAKRPATVDFTVDSVTWEKMDAQKPLDITVVQKEYAADPVPAVSATFTNKSFFDERNLEIIVMLLRADGNVYAASRTTVENLASGVAQAVTFTWPGSSFETPTTIEFLYRRLPE